MTNQVDRFYAALTVLAGHGHIKQRLIKAFDDCLSDVDEDELPIAMKQPFADLRRTMQRVAPLNGEGAVCASVRKMSPEDASSCASQIVALYGELSRGRDADDLNRPLGDEKQAHVPPFLVKSV
ncbi:MAG: hypothetical protein KJN77_02395 [Gammaproteobacteria bacterium]|nr:hypothetical protein [Gammaproteobacteria bacterium]